MHLPWDWLDHLPDAAQFWVMEACVLGFGLTVTWIIWHALLRPAADEEQTKDAAD